MYPAWKLFFKFFWTLACVGGLVYQAQYILRAYLSYDISTAVQIAFPANFTPPSITLCFYSVNLIRWAEANAKWPELKKKINKENYTNEQIQESILNLRYQEKFAIDQAFTTDILVADLFNYTYGSEELFHFCSRVNPNNYQVDVGGCDDFYEIDLTFTSALKCFTFNTRNDTLYDYLNVQRVAGVPGYLGAIVLKPEAKAFVDDMLVIYHPQHIETRQGFFRFLYVTKIHRLLPFTFNSYHMTLLPPPFKTMCRNYTTFGPGYADRAECFESCLVNKSREVYREIVPGPRISLKLHAAQRLISSEQVTQNESMSQRFWNMQAHCDATCLRQNCEEHYFVPKFMIATDYPIGAVATFAEMEPAVITVYSQKISFVQFITDFLSCFGFWLGLSVYSLFNILTRKIDRKRRKTHRQTELEWQCMQRQLADTRRKLYDVIYYLYHCHSERDYPKVKVRHRQLHY